MQDFNILAQTWDDEPRRIERAKIIAREITEIIPASSELTAMEFGCGTGLLSFFLRSCFKHITLVDSSEGMISVTREKIQKARIENMTPLCVDLFQARLQQKFHAIYTLMALHHIQDADGMLEILSQMIHPSGFLCIADLDEEDGSFHGPGFNGHPGFNRDALATKLQRLGFTEIQHKICYQNKKIFEDGRIRYYPVFLLTGIKQ